jgi:hypothetical protein
MKKNLVKNILDKAIITKKANQLLAELRGNPDYAIDEKNFKQGYLKALEWILSDTGIKQK